MQGDQKLGQEVLCEGTLLLFSQCFEEDLPLVFHESSTKGPGYSIHRKRFGVKSESVHRGVNMCKHIIIYIYDII